MSFPFPSMYQFTFTFQTLVIWSQNVIIGYKWSGPQKILHPIKNLEQWFRITHWCWEWMPYLFLFSYFSIYCMCQPKRLQANGRLLSQMHSPRHPCGTPRKNIYIYIYQNSKYSCSGYFQYHRPILHWKITKKFR